MKKSFFVGQAHEALFSPYKRTWPMDRALTREEADEFFSGKPVKPDEERRIYQSLLDSVKDDPLITDDEHFEQFMAGVQSE